MKVPGVATSISLICLVIGGRNRVSTSMLFLLRLMIASSLVQWLIVYRHLSGIIRLIAAGSWRLIS